MNNQLTRQQTIRADREYVFNYLLPKKSDGATKEQIDRAKIVLTRALNILGPVIEFYPAWHPFMDELDLSHKWGIGKLNHILPRESPLAGLDHTICFANGIITCPYDYHEELILRSYEDYKKNRILNHDHSHYVHIEPLKDVMLYHPNAKPYLITHSELELPFQPYNGSWIIARMLKRQLPSMERHSCAEPWEDGTKQEFLGYPSWGNSSLLVDSKTTSKMRKIWSLFDVDYAWEIYGHESGWPDSSFEDEDGTEWSSIDD
ncbi:hypothetical protein ZL58_14580 [Salmonella enterica subsp. enterica serovar Typhimurium]|nr:hypothetical protein [Salmonella enterica subsp. enterica serovar Typhimurium]